MANQTPDKLTKREQTWLKQFLLMAGREDPPVGYTHFDRAQIRHIRSVSSKLQESKANGDSIRARCNLLNKLILSLGIKTVSLQFFKTVFEDTDFSNIKALKKGVGSFRTVCMLEYGNFRFGYKQLRYHDTLIKHKWSSYFPSPMEAAERGRKYQSRLEPEGLIKIEPGELFALGNFEGGQLEIINAAREALRRIFSAALEAGVGDFARLKKVKAARNLPKLTTLIAQAGLPRAQDLVDCQGNRKRPFKRVLNDLLMSCDHIDLNHVVRIRDDGIKNARTYMTMNDLDVYVATSMRAPLHFTTNWAFVNNLFHSEPLSSWKLRYFDPTRTYLQSRLQTGLLEFLMIKRTRLTVYHAQESDTFGKDCEAGVTLAQGKPVVVFVTRLLDRQAEMKSLYEDLDGGAIANRDRYFLDLREKGLLSKKEAEFLLLDPGRTQADAIELIVRKYVPSILRKIGSDRAEMELIRQGYAPPGAEQTLANSVVNRITRLERRALRFRAHPLALQASPVDGVARGVIVTRTVADTAKVVSGLLGDTLTYEIVDDLEDWVLVDCVTRSPVRVVTKDEELTSAFWSENWRPKD